jgi:hypothetical protein
MVVVLAPAIEKALSRVNNMKAFEEAGLYPFTRKVLRSPHILATKGKTKKIPTLNYEALDYGKPVSPQVANLLGPGGRLTTGRICDLPLSHENNIKLFEALDSEKDLKLKGSAAKKRKKIGAPLPGDDMLLLEFEEYLKREFAVKLEGATRRKMKGKQTKGDEKLLASTKEQKAKTNPRAARKLHAKANPRPPQKRLKKTPKPTSPDEDSASDDDIQTDASETNECNVRAYGDDLVGKEFYEPDDECWCLITGKAVDNYGNRYLYYNLKGDREISSVPEVREWFNKQGREGQIRAGRD